MIVFVWDHLTEKVTLFSVLLDVGAYYARWSTETNISNRYDAVSVNS